MMKDICGKEIRIGDILKLNEGSDTDEHEVIKIDGPWLTVRYGEGAHKTFTVKWEPLAWLILRRAPSSPAPTPTEGERPVLGPVDCTGRPYRVGDRFVRVRGATTECVVSAISGGRVYLYRDGRDELAMRNDDLGHIVTDSPATEPAPPPSTPPPLVDAEELAARQRERHREEAARLQERYRAFHETVVRVVAEEAPRATVVSDMARKFGGVAFFAEIDFGGGSRATVLGGCAESGTGIAFDTKLVIDAARRELGSRLLKGGGKG